MGIKFSRLKGEQKVFLAQIYKNVTVHISMFEDIVQLCHVQQAAQQQ